MQHWNAPVNYAGDRRRPIARVHLATDRLTLPWTALEDSHSRVAILICWLAMAFVLLFAALPDFALVSDTSLARPASLADLPLVALTVPFEMVLPDKLAATLAAAALPLLQLLMALVLVRGTLRCLDFQGAAANIGLIIVPLLPLAIAAFTPLRMGEQAWEALCALLILRLAVDRRKPVRKALLAGFAGGILLLLSPTGALLTATVAAFFVLVYLREGDARCLSAFAFAAALCATALLLALEVLPQWMPIQDQGPGWPLLAGFWGAACIAGGLSFVRRPPPFLRVAGMVSVGLAVLAIPTLIDGMAPFSPADVSGSIGGTDPRAIVPSGGGVRHDAIGMVLATLALWLGAIATRWRMLVRSGNPRGWLAVAVLSGAMALLALFAYSAALLAQLLAVPVFALLLRDALRVASRLGSAWLRVAGVALALFALTPTGGAMATGLADTVAQGKAPTWPEPFAHAVAGLAAIGSPA